jgi:bacteriocin-like protein
VDTDRETCYNNAVLEKSVKQTILEEDADMSDEMKKLSEKQLDAVSGGTTANLVAAYDVLAGKYGEGQDRVNRLSAAGYNYNDVQSLVNALCKGYGPVAADVVNGRYGNNAARRANLIRAGYDPDQVQNLVNNMVWG